MPYKIGNTITLANIQLKQQKVKEGQMIISMIPKPIKNSMLPAVGNRGEEDRIDGA